MRALSIARCSVVASVFLLLCRRSAAAFGVITCPRNTHPAFTISFRPLRCARALRSATGVPSRDSRRSKSLVLRSQHTDQEDAEDRTLSGTDTLSRDALVPCDEAHDWLEHDQALCDTDWKDTVLSADFRTLHKDLCSWHDIYEWYQSYRMPSGVELQLQRDLCEAMRLGNMAEAKRLRKEITGLDAGDEVARLQNRLDAAVRLEDYEQAARLRDDLFLAQLSRQAACFPKFEVGLIVEHTRSHYRGVILALDKKCEASDDWVSAMAVDSLSRGRLQPFYSVLVDVNDKGPDAQICYVAQENLSPSGHGDSVEHPLVDRLFTSEVWPRVASTSCAEDACYHYQYEPGPELQTMLDFMAQGQLDK